MKLNSLFTDKGSIGTAFQYTAAIVVLLFVYLASMSVYRGWWTWLIDLPALAIMLATSIARVYDISERSKRWFVRRVGFIMAGTSVLAIGLAPLLGYTTAFPSWRGVVFSYGIAFVWLTTPGQPPWWKYINGTKKIKDITNDNT